MVHLYSAYIFCLVATMVVARPNDDRWWNHQQRAKDLRATQCGYESCPSTPSDKLNIHLVSHTHDDVGWLKTVDQYYYGSKSMTQKAGVQYILDSVVNELLRDPTRKFVYVESAFFFKWWVEQTEELQAKVKQLVSEGRLEFIGGAWSMNDEATPHYQSLIDQFSWGLKLLNDTFGHCGRPRVGWQIDPFGHSRDMASIFAQMGYDGMFFARLDYEDKRQRLSTKTPEMVWHASSNLGEAADLFTGILYNHYGPPPGFCFDYLCSDDPIIDDKHSPDNNVEKKVQQFIEYVRKMANNYRTNNLLIPMGDDFTYQDAHMWYKNLDLLIKYTNAKQAEGSNINLFYSTPSCYLKSLHDEDITWPSKNEDFFPYSSDPHAFWTGYFTSRPTLKRFERVGNNFLQVCKQLTTFAPNQKTEFEGNLALLKEAMGIMQHHDAITGTEKEQVAFDYARILDEAISACSENTKISLNDLSKGNSLQTPNFQFENCLLLNISVCEISENAEKFMVTLYNPLSQNSTQYVRFPVDGDAYEVLNFKEQNVPSQIVPVPGPIRNLPYRLSAATNELVFEAKNVPFKGHESYFISKKLKQKTEFVPEVHIVRNAREAVEDNSGIRGIENEHFQVSVNDNGKLIINTYGVTAQVSQEFLYYEGAVGNNLEFENRSSGAYIFRPNDTVRSLPPAMITKVVHGPLVQELHTEINNWISQVVRLYKGQNYIECEWLIGPVRIDDYIGKEMITRLSSTIQSNGAFYTDSNGREMLKRIRNKRETFEPNLMEKQAGNYYPITTKIALEDESVRLAVLTDRAQGGSSLEDGSLELMLHRRLLHDDAFGVGEPLNEVAYGSGVIARGKYHIFLGPSKSDMKAVERNVQLETSLPYWPFFSDISDMNFDDWSKFKHYHSSWNVVYPKNAHLMTIEPWGDHKTLVRFENILERSDDPDARNGGIINLDRVLPKDNHVINVRETTLDGNQWLDESQRFKFRTDAGSDDLSSPYIEMKNFVSRHEWDLSRNDSDFKLTLGPMQIRTFILTHP